MYKKAGFFFSTFLFWYGLPCLRNLNILYLSVVYARTPQYQSEGTKTQNGEIHRTVRTVRTVKSAVAYDTAGWKSLVSRSPPLCFVVSGSNLKMSLEGATAVHKVCVVCVEEIDGETRLHTLGGCNHGGVCRCVTTTATTGVLLNTINTGIIS